MAYWDHKIFVGSGIRLCYVFWDQGSQGPHTNCVTICSLKIIRECMRKWKVSNNGNAARNIYILVQNKHNRTSIAVFCHHCGS